MFWIRVDELMESCRPGVLMDIVSKTTGWRICPAVVLPEGLMRQLGLGIVAEPWKIPVDLQ